MIVIESTGRKLKDAIDNGLNELNKTLAEVEVEVLDNGGLFRKAKVRITVPGAEPAPVKTDKEKAQTTTEEKVQAEPTTKNEKTEKHEKPIKKASDPEITVERKEQKVKEQEVKEEQKSEVPKEPRHYEPVTPEVVKKVENFVTTLVQKMGIDAKIATTVEDGRLTISFETENSTIIGYHGEVLDSIEYITNYVLNHETEKFYHVVVDCNGYRDKRKESLVALANKMAAKCIRVHHKVSLEPMSSNERKIIHSALADNDQIITRSEGHEPNRHVVIICKKK